MEARADVPTCQFRVTHETPDVTTLLATRDWLTRAEQRELAFWRSPARRRDWLRGRWLAKEMLACWLDAGSIRRDQVEILSRNLLTGRGMPPQVLIDGVRLPRALSLAHVDDKVAVALACRPEIQVGIDLARVQSAATGFVRTWFTDREQDYFTSADGAEPTCFWAAKEALFKALRQERFMPKQWELTRLSPDLLQCRFLQGDSRDPWFVRTSRIGDHVMALAVAGPSS